MVLGRDKGNREGDSDMVMYGRRGRTDTQQASRLREGECEKDDRIEM